MKQESVWLLVSAISLAGIAMILFVLALVLRNGEKTQERKEERI